MRTLASSISVVVFFLLPFMAKTQLNYTLSANIDTFIAISGGTPATLSNFWMSGSETDDGYMNNVPLGFAFNYNGKSYSAIHITTNGMAAFGDTFALAGIFHSSENGFYANHDSVNRHRAYLAPMWDDLDVISAANLKFVTTGIAPSRVFAVEWNNVQWYGHAGWRASFQIQLYETTSDVRFVYRREAGNPPYNATVGISDTIPGLNHFISLLNVSPNPAFSSIYEVRIYQFPYTNQVYKFSFAPCGIPVLKLEGFTNNQISITNTAMGTNGFEYMTDTTITPPASGIITTSPTATAGSLNPSTQYYFHCRNVCNPAGPGPWKTVALKTSTDTVPLPYTQTFDNATQGSNLPDSLRTIRADTTRWAVSSILGNVASFGGNRYYTTSYCWFYLPPMYLSNAYAYKLRFSYGKEGRNDQVLFVKYHTEMDSSLTTGTQLCSITSFPRASLADTALEIQPSQPGNYYICFRASAYDSSVYVDNISVSLDSSLLPVRFISLKANRINKENVVKWRVAEENNVEGYFVQTSFDGISFKNAGFVIAKNREPLAEYTFTEKTLTGGKWHYRIAAKDKDGKITISPVVFLTGEEAVRFSLYPNPVRDVLHIITGGSDVEAYTIADMAGKVLKTEKTILARNSSILDISANGLANGFYVLKLVTKDKNDTAVMKFVVNK